MAYLERMDDVVHFRCTKKFVSEVDRKALSVGLSRADYLRLVTSLAVQDRDLKLVPKKKGKKDQETGESA